MSVKSYLSASVAQVAAAPAAAEPTEAQKARWLSEVKEYGLALQYVPSQHRTPEVCLEAVKQHGFALVYVTHITPEICLEAVKQDGEALYYVPAHLKNPEICMEAVKQNGWALQYVPEDLKTPEICLEAVRQSGEAITYIKVAQIRQPGSEALCEYLDSNWDSLRHRLPKNRAEALARAVDKVLTTQETAPQIERSRA